MPSTFKSPFATTFKNAIKKGTPCSVVVQNICKRNNKTPKTVFESLWKAGLCWRQKVNGQWIYWPCCDVKVNKTNAKTCQVNMWQHFVDWCICSGVCTPEQIKNCCGSQPTFMNGCKKFWNKQTSTATKRTTGRKTTNYKFAGTGRKTATRRYSRAA